VSVCQLTSGPLIHIINSEMKSLSGFYSSTPRCKEIIRADVNGYGLLTFQREAQTRCDSENDNINVKCCLNWFVRCLILSG